MHAFEHGHGLSSSASRSFATPHVTAPPSPFLYRSSRACMLSVSLWRLRSRSCEHARAFVQMLGKCVQESERKRLRRKGERTSCRVAARGAARALRSACGAGTHADSQRGLRYKACAQLPEHSSEPMDTHIKLCVSRTYEYYSRMHAAQQEPEHPSGPALYGNTHQT